MLFIDVLLVFLLSHAIVVLRNSLVNTTFDFADAFFCLSNIFSNDNVLIVNHFKQDSLMF